MLQITTNELGDRKKVEIDGHLYTVRNKAPAGDQMDISQLMRELTRIGDKEKSSELTEKDYDRIDEIEQKIISITSRTFDDGGDGSKSIELVKSLNEDQMRQLMDKIFEKEKAEDEPAADQGNKAT